MQMIYVLNTPYGAHHKGTKEEMENLLQSFKEKLQVKPENKEEDEWQNEKVYLDITIPFLTRKELISELDKFYVGVLPTYKINRKEYNMPLPIGSEPTHTLDYVLVKCAEMYRHKIPITEIKINGEEVEFEPDANLIVLSDAEDIVFGKKELNNCESFNKFLRESALMLIHRVYKTLKSSTIQAYSAISLYL